MKKQAVLSLSGGMDSSTVLLHLLANDYEVTALSFDYGQKHNVELERASELIEYLDKAGYPVKYQRITLQGLVSLLNSNLVQGGDDVPEGHYEEENMKDTVVPNRNKMFSSIIQAAALSIANAKNCEVKIAMGIHAGDHAIYPDCRQEFRDADDAAFRIGNWEAERVGYFTPYLDTDKYGILQDGVSSSTRMDGQAKSLGEYLRAKKISRRSSRLAKQVRVMQPILSPIIPLRKSMRSFQ